VRECVRAEEGGIWETKSRGQYGVIMCNVGDTASGINLNEVKYITNMIPEQPEGACSFSLLVTRYWFTHQKLSD
jgi:hypothetical protein